VGFFGASGWRYWHRRADERLGDPASKVQPGAFMEHESLVDLS